MSTDKDLGKAGWNISQSLIQNGAQNLAAAESYYARGYYNACFQKTREWILLIQQYLNKDDISKLKKLEKKISLCGKQIINAKAIRDNCDFQSDASSAAVKLKNAKVGYPQLIFEYRQLMARLLHKAGFGVSAKSDQSKMFS